MFQEKRKGILIKRVICSACFVLILFCLVTNCLAYNIKPCAGKDPSGAGEPINLVFCSLNYKDNVDFVQDREMLIRRLKITKPFDIYGNFRFWYIDLSRQEEEMIFKPVAAFPPLETREDFLVYISQRLKGAYKLVIIDAQGSVPCAELSRARESSLIILGRKSYDSDNNLAKGFLHELGHAFGLRDECASCRRLSSGGYPNCASSQEEAKRWWGDLAGKDDRVGYISGCCGNINYIRPTIASLMNDFHKAQDFGPVNERYLRQELTGGS
ncbi:MAG: hypothetical protein V1869_05870 [Candidatus Omnitrophota bacterium]